MNHDQPSAEVIPEEIQNSLSILVVNNSLIDIEYGSYKKARYKKVPIGSIFAKCKVSEDFGGLSLKVDIEHLDIGDEGEVKMAVLENQNLLPEDLKKLQEIIFTLDPDDHRLGERIRFDPKTNAWEQFGK